MRNYDRQAAHGKCGHMTRSARCNGRSEGCTTHVVRAVHVDSACEESLKAGNVAGKGRVGKALAILRIGEAADGQARRAAGLEDGAFRNELSSCGMTTHGTETGVLTHLTRPRVHSRGGGRHGRMQADVTRSGKVQKGEHTPHLMQIVARGASGSGPSGGDHQHPPA
jgi:hypothetical protein